MPHSPGLDLTNLLLGLAWLGELDRRQIQRLWFVDKSESTVEKILTQLRKDGLLAKRARSIRDEQRGVTVPQLASWSLTPEGHRVVKASDQYPAKPAQVRQQRLIPHDAHITEAIVRLIEPGRRSKLSGLYIAHEVRLDHHQCYHRPLPHRGSGFCPASRRPRRSTQSAASGSSSPGMCSAGSPRCSGQCSAGSRCCSGRR